ncbi:MAG: polyprenol monophosphomannose synthase [Candidatus Omnitrophica bacterium]|nr:polyprenol monophosphomannose synthase [Candidatus Omnitrophota bacterium]
MQAIVVIPTLNERENLKELVRGILSVHPDIHILVVDDHSVDGTDLLVRQIQDRHPRVQLIIKKGPPGRGLADLEGFRYALVNNFDYIIQMDGDLSHQPKYIRQLLDEIKNCDVVIGSRFIRGGKIAGRGIYRNILTKLANFYIQILLGINVKDCTSGFRCFRRSVLESLSLARTSAAGPACLIEILYACHKRNYTIKEIPITFIDRKKGKSKLRARQLWEAIQTVVRIKLNNVY